MATKREISGTKEWSAKSVNCQNGCSHNCRYCYAKHDAVNRFGRMTEEEWTTEKIRPHDVNKKHPKYGGTVMFPTTHDITPANIDACITVLTNLLKAKNEVLIVSKPHVECIKKICDAFPAHKGQILFRFTIGSFNDDILAFWEPGAPKFIERLASLKLAFDAGFETSVSIEPMLDVGNIQALVERLTPYVTHSIWLGKMNHIRQRVKSVSQRDEEELQRIEEEQTDARIKSIYDSLKDNPLIRWKESIKKIVGVPLAEKAGADV